MTGDGTLRVHDTGIGLTEAQVHELLATIGRCSKRDELGFARHEFLGQFGIGLLSCFLVADEIEVLTRAAGAPTVRWIGLRRRPVRGQPRRPSSGPAQGTTVTLRAAPRRRAVARPAPTVTELATLYGSLLPVTDPRRRRRLDHGRTAAVAGAPDRRPRPLRDYAREHVGLDPFDMVELNVPEAGLTGVAFVLPMPANPAARAGHRVYLKRMLLAESADGLLPDWAFFARCVVDATELRPTASREALYEDGLLESVREALGDQLRGWLVRLAARDPRPAGRVPGHPPPRRQGAGPARRRDAAPGRPVAAGRDQRRAG